MIKNLIWKFYIQWVTSTEPIQTLCIKSSCTIVKRFFILTSCGAFIYFKVGICHFNFFQDIEIVLSLSNK